MAENHIIIIIIIITGLKVKISFTELLDLQKEFCQITIYENNI